VLWASKARQPERKSRISVATGSPCLVVLQFESRAISSMLHTWSLIPASIDSIHRYASHPHDTANGIPFD
jgi:hypothetical protein